MPKFRNSTKAALLEVLKQTKNTCVSGQRLAQRLNISRTAVWKHINSLCRDGYAIKSCGKLGYMYMGGPNKLLPLEITYGLKTEWLGRYVIHYTQVGSTQDIAKEMVSKRVPHGTLIIAEAQTKGRGRLGRIWLSPEGQGLYFSLILRPQISPIHAPKLTLMAGVAIARTIELTTSIKSQIKWPNDILISGRKVAGILNEIDAEMDKINAIILGIGININQNTASFPKELRNEVTSLKLEVGSEISRLEILQALLVELENLCEVLKDGNFPYILGAWRKMDITLGSQVKAVLIDREISGKAIDIDQDGALLLKDRKGDIYRLLSGDLTLLRVT